MKNLPNIITLGNLFCGCVAIAFILHWQPVFSVEYNLNNLNPWFSGSQQAYFGCLFIFIAAFLDLLDGAAARALGVSSPIGKDLDSLADIVSFGVAPAMILMKMLWAAWMRQPNAIDASVLLISPAFLLACFGAYRLAKFNNAPETTAYFSGVPTPAVGLVVASLPLVLFYNPLNVAQAFNSPWTIYLIIAILCWLMISNIRFFTLKGLTKGNFKENIFPVVWLGLSILSIIFLKTLGVTFSFLLYIILSLGMQGKLKKVA